MFYKMHYIEHQTLFFKYLTEGSCSTIKSIGSYSERNFVLFQSLVASYVTKHGCEKNIPQKLFRVMQEMTEASIFSYLSLAEEEGIEKTAILVDRLKARESLQIFFCKAVRVTNWMTASKIYPDATNKIEEHVEKKLKRKFVPEDFAAYCNALKSARVAQEENVTAAENSSESVPDTQPPQPLSNKFSIDIIIKSKGKDIIFTEEVQKIIVFHKSVLEKALPNMLPSSEE